MINVIIPCFNEEKSIVQTIDEIRDSSNQVSKIIVVDNASKDRTAVWARKAGAVVVHEPLQGKGFAFRRGLTELDPDCSAVFLIDGDSTYGIDQLDEAARLVTSGGYDMIVGERISSADAALYRFGHRTGNRIFTRAHNFLFSMQITDSLSGWRLMSRGFAVSFSAGASKFELETELNAHAYHLSASVTSVEVKYRRRPEGSHSKLNTYRDGLKILRRNTNLWRSERPFLAYSVLSLPWFVFSTLLFARVLAGYLETGLVPKFPSLIVSMGAFVIGANLWIAGIILERTNLQRVALARYIYLQESLRRKGSEISKNQNRNLRRRKKSKGS